MRKEGGGLLVGLVLSTFGFLFLAYNNEAAGRRKQSLSLGAVAVAIHRTNA